MNSKNFFVSSLAFIVGSQCRFEMYILGYIHTVFVIFSLAYHLLPTLPWTRRDWSFVFVRLLGD